MNTKVNKKRGIYAMVFICVLCALFLTHLFRVQVIGTKEENAAAVSVVSVSVPSIRGEILDRNGYPLVTNKQVNKIIFNYLAFPKNYTERNEIIIELIRMFKKNKVEWNDNLQKYIFCSHYNGKELYFPKSPDSSIKILKVLVDIVLLF